jgi:spermidine synthase
MKPKHTKKQTASKKAAAVNFSAWINNIFQKMKQIIHNVLEKIGLLWENVVELLKKIKPLCNKLRDVFKKIYTQAKLIYKWLSPAWLKLPDSVVFFAAIFLSSFFVIAFETIQFHVLLFTTNYLNATFIISIAMLGIAIGSILGFYLNRIRTEIIILFSSAGLFYSIVLSYYNIINIGFLKYPYFLILPFVFASIIIATIFAKRNSNAVYFTNLISSALGIIFPILFVPVFKSENCIFMLMFIPIIIVILLCLKIGNVLLKIPAVILCGVIFFWLAGFINSNLTLPETIPAAVFEEKIISEMPRKNITGYRKNYTLDFFKTVYEKQEDDTYVFTSDSYDKERVDYFLRVLGFKPRFEFFPLLMFEKVTPIASIESISADVFEYELIPEIEEKYDMSFDKNYDRMFLEKVYKKDEVNNVYSLNGTDYDHLRAKYLLTALGHFDTFDLNFDIKYHGSLRDLYKTFTLNHRILLSEDNMLGRIEYTGDDDYMFMSVDGVILDGIDSYNGAHFDPRVPRIPHQQSPKVFIVGLSADGIVKSCKRLPDAEVTGVEINPIVVRTMSEQGQFADFAHRPYDNVDVYEGEGRSHLENTNKLYDMICLMNIHMEHSPISTLSPEYFHTIEGTRLLLDKINSDGYVVYEEIIVTRRSYFFFLKFLNTIKQAMREMGIKEPEKHMHVFSWDFAEGGNAFRTLTIKRTPFTREEEREFNQYLANLRNTGYYFNVNLLYSPFRRTYTELESFITEEDETERIEIPSGLLADDFIESIVSRLQDSEDIRFVLSHYNRTSYNTFWISYNRLNNRDKYRLKKILDEAGYPYTLDLAPVSDDDPFPFNIYKNRNEVRDIFYLVIMLSMILILPVVLLILTKMRQYKMSLIIPNLFVAIIGFGYMLVEIVLMQKFQRFIGSPTYSLIVILGGLLFFSGIGSFVSRFFSKKLIILCIIAIPLFLGMKLLYLDDIFRSLAALGFTEKIIVSAFLIMPLTFLMGIPFPNALEIVKANTSAEYASLLFGISGAFSTIGSTSSLYISVSYGFSTTFLVGAGCYIAGLLLFLLIIRKKA